MAGTMNMQSEHDPILPTYICTNYQHRTSCQTHCVYCIQLQYWTHEN